MNRTIKFRVWDLLNKEWIPQKKLSFYYFNIHNQNSIVQQFTGLKDKNGKEIYEGDIIVYQDEDDTREVSYLPSKVFNSKPFYIVYSDVEAAYKMRGRGKETYPIPCLVTVIGNIFENPNLINL